MILILGGTGEARGLGTLLRDSGIAGEISMAGVTRAPAPQALPVRVGGFGGAAGMRAYLRERHVRAVVDATHPFSRDMTNRAAQLCREMDLPFLRVERPGWEPQPGDRWERLTDPCLLRAHLPLEGRIFLTTGPGHVADFGLEGRDVLCRRIDASDAPPPPGWRWLVARPPFALEDEIALLKRENITHLVTKNSGGEQAAAKLGAARHLGLPVLMLERKTLPEGIEIAASIWAAMGWIEAL